MKTRATNLAFIVQVVRDERGQCQFVGEAIGTGTSLRCQSSATFDPRHEARALAGFMAHLAELACDKITLVDLPPYDEAEILYQEAHKALEAGTKPYMPQEPK